MAPIHAMALLCHPRGMAQQPVLLWAGYLQQSVRIGLYLLVQYLVLKVMRLSAN
ncbi:hypothetical protein [Citrobacter braakii]|uniref:hypothetical protein n=1 Tax=Citrobacter braakii TaxID=57706 RepID=UPI0040393120